MKLRARHQSTPAAARSSEPFLPAAWVVFAAALAVRLIHIWEIRRAPFFNVLMGDARAYDEWAQQIARGDWIGHNVFYQAPLYPYFLGLVYTIAGRSLLIVRISQAVIGALSCVLLGLAAAGLFSGRVGLVAGLLLAFYAPAIFFDSLLQKSVLDVFFVCLMLWLVSLNHGTHKNDRAAASPSSPSRSSWSSWSLWSSWFLGLAAGALSLTRENAMVFTAVILGWVMTRPGVPRRGRAAGAGVFLLGLTIVLGPVVVRNHAVGGGFYVTTSQFGPNFYIGNNPRADGTYMSLRYGRGAPEYERQDATELAEQATGRRLTPSEVSSYWTARALDFVTSEPARWLKLMARKSALLWNASEMLDTESQESYAEWSVPLRIGGILGHFGVLAPLALLGVSATWSRRRELWVVYAMLGAYAASVVTFYVFARYRFPLVPFLVLFASIPVAIGLGFVASGFSRIAPIRLKADPAYERRMGGTTIVAAMAVAIVTNWRMLSPDLMQAITENNLAVALQAEGRYDEATDHYRRAIALRSDYAPAYNNMGVALRATGHVLEAIATYERAIELQPDYPDVHYNVANALLAQGRIDRAIDEFRLALQSTAGSAEAHNNLGIALASSGKLDEAIAEFRAALQLDPGRAGTHRNLGDALASERSPEAFEHLRRAVELDPGDAEAHYDLASALLEARQFNEAIGEFHATLKLTPASVQAHNNLGIALASSGRLDEAIEQFREALRLQPGFEDAQRNLAMALQVTPQGARDQSQRTPKTQK